MAARAVAVTPVARIGLACAAVVAALTLAPLIAVAWRAEGLVALSGADWAAVRFTLAQAVVSALLSVLLAIPVARALARRRFPGRGWLITLLGAPFLLPVIVAILGLLAIFGRRGVVNAGLEAAGLPALSIYGFHGVVLAHVFFNLPLATRLILQAWLAIPAERFRVAAHLGMGPRDVRRWIERPMLRQVVPGALVIVFALCLTSFAVALTLGGGPRATTVELAIYQAFRLDFDLGRAAVLALIQMAMTVAAALIALRVPIGTGQGVGLDRVVARWDARARASLWIDAAILAAAALFVAAPMAVVVARGLPFVPEAVALTWPAMVRSVLVSAVSATLTLAIALPMALAVTALGRRPLSRGIEAVAYLGVAASPMVLGTGLFLILRPLADPLALALPVTAAVNALVSLPFALRALIPAVRDAEAGFGRLAESLGLRGAARWRIVLRPRLRRPIGFAAGLAAGLSMGDLGVIALFADPAEATLPLEVLRLMGAYRMDAAAGAALCLFALSLGAFWICDRGGRADAVA